MVNSKIGEQWLERKANNFRYRLQVISAALFKRWKDLPPQVVVRTQQPIPNGWANVFDLLSHARTWQEKPRAEFVALCKTPTSNRESAEPDTAHLMYDLARWRRASRVTEVGVFIGATSLHLAQALSDNGGGELHLVDLDAERLADVEAKIRAAGLNVTVITHAGHSAKLAKQGALPGADLIFMDAEHYYEPIVQEIDSYFPLVRPGGIMVIHDTILYEGARRRANELFGMGYTLFTLASSLGAGVTVILKPAATQS